MSNDIKPGDLVMVVKPARCCGSCKAIGRVYIAGNVEGGPIICSNCGHIGEATSVNVSRDRWCEVGRLKKLDPPAEGDSLPTRADIDVEETA